MSEADYLMYGTIAYGVIIVSVAVWLDRKSEEEGEDDEER